MKIFGVTLIGQLVMDWRGQCLDCKVDPIEIDEFYMVHDKVWAEAGMKNTLGVILTPRDFFGSPWLLTLGSEALCISCLEIRLNRILTPDDFTDLPINKRSYVRSALLFARLNGIEYFASP